MPSPVTCELTQDTKISDMTSKISYRPVVSIDEIGTILNVNQALESVFGYAEVLAPVSPPSRIIYNPPHSATLSARTSVSCSPTRLLSSTTVTLRGMHLPTPPVFPCHAHLPYRHALSRYKQTRVARIVGTSRQLQAKRKNGTFFHAKVSVNEVRVQGSTIYVGSIVDVDHQIELDGVLKTTVQILNLNTLGIVTICEKGLITRMNTSALDMFGYESDEVLTHNVKMLMPEHTARSHDSFLQHYKKTGIKRIIDTKRTLMAKRKDDSTFLCEVSLKEIKLVDQRKKELPPVFIGYLRDLTSEEKSKEARAICNVITQLNTTPVVSIDVNGRVLKYTSAAEECFGWTASEILSEKIEMLMPPETAEKHQGYLNRYMETKEKKIIDKWTRLRALRKNGKSFSMKLMVREVPGNKYFTSTFIGFLEDMTTEDGAELTIKLNAALVSGSPVAIVKITQQGIIKEANTSAAALFGYEASELLNENVKRLVSIEHREKHDGYLANYLQTGVKKVIGTQRQLVGCKADGTEIALTVKIREMLLKMQPPEYIGYLAPADTVAKYDEVMHRNKLTLDILDTPVLVINEKGIVVKMSPPAENALGFTAQELVGSPVNAIMPPDVAEIHDEKLQRYLKTRKPVMIGSRTEVVAQAKSGYQFPAIVQVQQIDTTHSMYFVGILKPLE